MVPPGAGATTDLWVFEGTDGRDYAYTGTMAAATMYAWDVTDPTNPVITDSVKVDGRRQNDVKINADATLAVITSEGASNRRNGFTILDISDAAHPTIITHFTEGLTGGCTTCGSRVTSSTPCTTARTPCTSWTSPIRRIP